MEPLSDEQERVLQLLKDRGVNFRCPACDDADLTITDVYGQIALTPALVQPVTTFYPFVVLGCPNCGNTRFHRTEVLGLS